MVHIIQGGVLVVRFFSGGISEIKIIDCIMNKLVEKEIFTVGEAKQIVEDAKIK